MNEMFIKFIGPFNWPGYNDEIIKPFKVIPSDSKGVYLWTFEYNIGFVVYAAGITRRTFKQRFKEHTKSYLAGVYTIFDMDKIRIGEKVTLWPGFLDEKENP